MFCSSCGKEVSDGVKFCPSCGKEIQATKNGEKVMENKTSGTNIVKSVKVKGGAMAGRTLGGMKLFIPIVVLALVIAMASESEPVLSIILFLIECVLLTVARSSMPKTIEYDEISKSFISNKKALVKQGSQSVAVSDIKAVKIMYVKMGIFSKKQPFSYPGKYYVLVLSTSDTVNLRETKDIAVWFKKKANMEEFIPTVEFALKECGSSVTIERDETLVKF